MSRLYVALLFVFAAVGSSVAAEPRFEPGELLVGYTTPSDRDAALKRLSGAKDVLRVRGERLVNVEIQPVDDKAVRLHLTFPAPVVSATHNNPSEEIAVLQDVAKQIKDADHSVEYAHPNWIAEAKMSLLPERPAPQVSHLTPRHIAKTHRMASHRRTARHRGHHAALVAWERRHRRAKERRWSYGFSWPFSFSSHCWSKTWVHPEGRRTPSKHSRSALR